MLNKPLVMKAWWIIKIGGNIIMMLNDGDGLSNVGDDVWVVGVIPIYDEYNWVVNDVHVDNDMDIRQFCKNIINNIDYSKLIN
jgi:hypothetical protein